MIAQLLALKWASDLRRRLLGKNSVVVDPNCDLKTAARRILWGRFSNAGQVRGRLLTHRARAYSPWFRTLPLDLCVPRVCPCSGILSRQADRSLQGSVSAFARLAPLPVPHSLLILSRYNAFYPSGPEDSDSFARVISTAHAERIAGLLASSRGTVVLGGAVDPARRYIAPTVVRDVRADDALMSEEIFGPVLCVLPVRDVEEAVEIVNAQ